MTPAQRSSSRHTRRMAENRRMAFRAGEQHLLELTERDMDELLAAVASPPLPNTAMQRAVSRWRKRMAQQCDQRTVVTTIITRDRRSIRALCRAPATIDT